MRVNQLYLVRALFRVIARRKRLQDVEDTQDFDKVGIVFGKFSFQTGQVVKKIRIRFDSQRESQIVIRNLKSTRPVCERNLTVLETISIELAKKWSEESLVRAGRRITPIHVEEIEILRVVTILQEYPSGVHFQNPLPYDSGQCLESIPCCVFAVQLESSSRSESPPNSGFK